MDIPLNVEVQGSDGLIGRSTTIILNPATRTVTHFVVGEHKAPHTERVVPIKLVKDTTPDLILLRCNKKAFSNLETFLETHYLRLEMPDRDDIPRDALMWPYRVHNLKRTYPLKSARIPPDELAIRRGARVVARDGRIGVVEEFLIEPNDGHITHLVLREGHLWGKKEVAIPVSEIDKIEENTVRLKLDKKAVGELSSVPVMG